MWLLRLYLAVAVAYLLWRGRYLSRPGIVVRCHVCKDLVFGTRCWACGEPRPRRLM